MSKQPAKWIDEKHRIGVFMCREMYLNYKKPQLDDIDEWKFVEKSGRIALYKYDEQYIVVFRGTNVSGDLKTVYKDLYDDILLATGNDQYVSIVEEGNKYIDALLERGIQGSQISLTGHSLGGYAALKVSDKHDIKSFVFNAAAPATNPVKFGPGKISYNYHIVGDGVSSHMGDKTSNIVRAYKKTTFFKTLWNHELDRFFENDPTYGFWNAEKENRMFQRDKEVAEFLVEFGNQILPILPKWIPEIKPKKIDDYAIPGEKPDEDKERNDFLFIPWIIRLNKSKEYIDRFKNYNKKVFDFFERDKKRKLFTRKDLDTVKIYKDALYPLRESNLKEESDVLKRIRLKAESQWDAEGRDFTNKKVNAKDIKDLKPQSDLKTPRNFILKEIFNVVPEGVKEYIIRADHINQIINKETDLEESDFLFIDREKRKLQDFFDKQQFGLKINEWWNETISKFNRKYSLHKELKKQEKIVNNAVKAVRELEQKAKRARGDELKRQEDDFIRASKQARRELEKANRIDKNQKKYLNQIIETAAKNVEDLDKRSRRIRASENKESFKSAKAAEGAYKKQLSQFRNQTFKPSTLRKQIIPTKIIQPASIKTPEKVSPKLMVDVVSALQNKAIQSDKVQPQTGF
jgi:hypothetical protein